MSIFPILKYLSITLICCAISMFGSYLSNNYSKKVTIRKEFIRLLYHILSSIKYTSKSVEEICQCFESDVFTEEISAYFTYLTNEENNALKELFSKLGKAYSYENALLICSHAKETLEESDKLHSKSDKAKAILYKKLGLSAAILTAIILI